MSRLAPARAADPESRNLVIAEILEEGDRADFAALKSRFGIERQHLETLLSTPPPAA